LGEYLLAPSYFLSFKKWIEKKLKLGLTKLMCIMMQNSNSHTWSSTIRGRAVKNNFLHKYTLKIVGALAYGST